LWAFNIDDVFFEYTSVVLLGYAEKFAIIHTHVHNNCNIFDFMGKPPLNLFNLTPFTAQSHLVYYVVA
jgi:hypothetical protein